MNVALVFCLDDDVTLDYLVREVGTACADAGILCKGEQVSDVRCNHVYTSPGLPPEPALADMPYPARPDAEAERIRASMLDLDDDSL